MQNSAWWRERLKGVPGRSATFADVALLDRAAFRASIEHAGGPLPLPQAHGVVVKKSTSGSSGVPVEFYLSDLVIRMRQSHIFYDHIHQGRDLSRVSASIMNYNPDHESSHIAHRSNVLLGGGVTLERKTQQFSIEEHARWLAEVRPAYFHTAPTVLEGMLDVYESGAVEPPRLEQIITGGETVTPSCGRGRAPSWAPLSATAMGATRWRTLHFSARTATSTTTSLPLPPLSRCWTTPDVPAVRALWAG